MKQYVTESKAIKALMECYTTKFSYEGAKAMFDYLENLEEETGQEIEFDPVAIGCDFTELTIPQALRDYDLPNTTDSFEEFMENTVVIFVDELADWKGYDNDCDENCRIIFQAY